MTERMVEEATLTKAKSLANRSKNGSPDLATPTRDPSGSRTSEGQLLYRHQGVMSNAGLNTPTEEVSAPPPGAAATHVSHDGSADVPKELPEAADLKLISEVQEAPKGSRRLRWLLVFDDVFALCCAWPLAVLLTRTSSTDVFSRSEGGFLPIIAGVTWLLIASNKLYRSRVCSVRSVENAALVRACVLGGVAAFLVAPRVQAHDLRLRTLVVGQLLSFLFVLLGRTTYRAMLRRARRLGRFIRPVALIGTGDEAYELLQLMVEEPELGYLVIGVIGDQTETENRKFSVPYLGPTNEKYLGFPDMSAREIFTLAPLAADTCGTTGYAASHSATVRGQSSRNSA